MFKNGMKKWQINSGYDTMDMRQDKDFLTRCFCLDSNFSTLTNA